MSVAEIKQELPNLSVEERLEVASYIRFLNLRDDPAFQAELDQRNKIQGFKGAATEKNECAARINTACALYAQGQITLGQAAEIAQLSQAEMQKELGRRRIAAHYDIEDLEADLVSARELARK